MRIRILSILICAAWMFISMTAAAGQTRTLTKDEYKKAEQSLLDAVGKHAYRVEYTEELREAKGGKLKARKAMTIESIPPDLHHRRIKMTFGDSSSTVEHILIGEKSFWRQGDGPWSFDGPTGPQYLLIDDVLPEELFSAEYSVKKSALNGTPMDFYERKLTWQRKDDKEKTKTTSIERTSLWVRPDGNLAKRYSERERFDGGPFWTTTEIFEAAAGLKIEEPIVKGVKNNHE